MKKGRYYIFIIILAVLFYHCKNNSSKTISTDGRDSLNSLTSKDKNDSLDIKKTNGWQDVTDRSRISGSEVYSLLEYNGKIYAGGGELQINGMGKECALVALDGETWEPIGDKFIRRRKTWGATINALITYNNEFYVGGTFDFIGEKPVSNIAKWNGTNWDQLTSGISGKDTNHYFIEAFAVYNNELYVGGHFDCAGGKVVNNLAKWDGKIWKETGVIFSGKGYETRGTDIDVMKVYKGSLYIGGHFDSVGDIAAHNIAMWDGNKWSSLKDGIGLGNNSYVSSLLEYNNDLYVGGHYNSAGGSRVFNIAKWNGSEWNALGAGITGGSPYLFGDTVCVSALILYNNKLYVGGCFDSAGGKVANNIAIWDGKKWSTITNSSDGTIGLVNHGIDAFLSYKGYLYVSGDILNPDGTCDAFICKWSSNEGDNK